MLRFAQSYGAIIEKAPLQAYLSALIFSPACSLNRRLFTHKEPEWIVEKPRVEQNWSSCLATLMGHVDRVYSVAFSPDGHHIVSGSSDCTVKIWDAESGAETLTLQGHTNPVWSVAFDKEGKFITSKSDDATVKTWDAETGACISTYEGVRNPTGEVALSQHNRRRTERLPFDGMSHFTNSGSSTGVLAVRGHNGLAESVALSHDNRLIASGSDDMTVKIWDAVTGVELSTLQGHNGEVLSVSFSPDAHRIASGSLDETIKIWDVESSAEIPTLQGHCGHRDQVNSIALTLDGRRIASGSYDNTVKIWDAETGDNIRTIEYEFSAGISSVTFSPDGRRIAAAGDRDNQDTFVVISDAESGATISTCDLPCDGALTLSLDGPLSVSLDGRYIATGWEQTVKTQDSVDGKNVSTLTGHSGHVTSLAFSPRDCHIVVSASLDKTIKIWNVVTGAEGSTLNVGTEIHLLRFDPTGACLHTDSLLGYRDSVWTSYSVPSHTDIFLPQLKKVGYGFGVDGSWVTWHGQNILWLPPEFRRSEGYPQRPWDVLPHMISIGCPSGRVWWIKFSSKHHPLAVLE